MNSQARRKIDIVTPREIASNTVKRCRIIGLHCPRCSGWTNYVD